MSDKAANEKWVWLKGGAFLLVGVVGSTILILQHPDSLTIVLLLAIVCSFCRAYRTAIYDTEHYVDPGFKYMGLLSFWDYIFDQRNRSSNTGLRLRYSCDDVARNNYHIKSMVLNWIAISILACIFLPTLFDELMMQLRPKGFTNSKLIALLPNAAHGFGASLFAALAAFAGLASWSIRFRIPVVLMLHLIMCSCCYLGYPDQRRAAYSCFVWPGAVFLITFAMCSVARWFLGWRLVACYTLGSTLSRERPNSNWGISYLFFLTAMVAACISLVSSILPPDVARFRFHIPLAGLGVLIEIALVTNCCVLLLFAAGQESPGKWPLACCLFAIVFGPLAFTLLMSLGTGILRDLLSSLRAAYAFQFGLVVGLAALFTSARFAQVRLHKQVGEVGHHSA